MKEGRSSETPNTSVEHVKFERLWSPEVVKSEFLAAK
jgi:hypothetical protein